MKGASRGEVQPREHHPRGSGGGRASIGSGIRAAGGYDDRGLPGGAVSSSLQEAWRRARMERDSEPAGARRIQLGIALATGLSLSDAGSLTILEAHWLME